MKYAYLILAHSPHTGKVFTTRIRDCSYREARKRFLDRYGDYDESFVIISITEVARYV